MAASIDGKVLPCTVADVSLGGARLIFDTDLPQAAGDEDATIELNHPDGEPVHCATVWRSNREVGIVFDFSEDSLGLISICLRNIIDLDRQPGMPAG